MTMEHSFTTEIVKYGESIGCHTLNVSGSGSLVFKFSGAFANYGCDDLSYPTKGRLEETISTITSPTQEDCAVYLQLQFFNCNGETQLIITPETISFKSSNEGGCLEVTLPMSQVKTDVIILLEEIYKVYETTG